MTSRKDKANEKRAHNFIESFKALSLAGLRRPRPAASSNVPGGFASSPHLPMPVPPSMPIPMPSPAPRLPPYPNDNNAAAIPPPPILYSNPNGAVPQHPSRTMLHAMGMVGSWPDGAPTTPLRAPAAPRPVAGPSHTPTRLYADMPVPHPVSEPSLSPPPPRDHPRTPQPQKLQPPRFHRRARSEPPSPSDSAAVAVIGGTRQCSGVTTAGKQCRNQVKVSDAQALAGGDVFCRVHGNKVGEVSGFYDRKTGQTFIKFDDWIPEYLQAATKNALRVEMQKARAQSDVEGYIYTFEILDTADKKTIHLKVGRATNLNRRMDQWGKQCGSKEQILRGFWPGGMEKGGVPMKGLVQAGPKGPWCHRIERLVHIELADLVEYTPYLEDEYPSVGASNEVKKGGKKDVKRCPDCNTKHQEIFSFERVVKGRYQGKEWEDIVKPVIEKWGGFVEAYL